MAMKMDAYCKQQRSSGLLNSNRRNDRQRIWITLIAVGLLVGRCSAESLFTRVHPAMGTDFTLYIYAADAASADREAERVFSIVDQLDSLLSNYQPQSELSRINHEPPEHAVTTDPETFRFLGRIPRVECAFGWRIRPHSREADEGLGLLSPHRPGPQ